jgi:hypothetical protein
MKLYLGNLLSRVKEYSQSLDIKEVFVECPWVIIDENKNQQKYIFKRNGDLIMSLNGQVTIGKWEYLSAAKSLVIDRNVDKILLNQNFVDPVVMVLKMDGAMNHENLILANEILLPDLDVVKYLKKLLYYRKQIKTDILKSGEHLEFNNFSGYISGNIVTIEGENVPDGILEFAESEKKILVKQSKIIKVLVPKKYTTDWGEIVIDQEEHCPPSNGDVVLSKYGAHVPDGKYRIGFMKSINVQNGKVVK